jgi:NADH-quinone oxidoreductase subunit N
MLLRIFLEGLPSLTADWSPLFEAMAIVTMTVGNVAALTQTNLKRMLAYSSIAHAGYVLIGVVAGPPRGVTAILIYVLIYSFMQIGAFAVIVMMRRKDVAGDELKDFSGLHARHPLAAFAMLLFMLSLGGIPLTLALAIVATIVLGVYPQLLFEVAEKSAHTLGLGGTAAAIR